MKYLTCQNNDPTSKYFKGRQCYEEVLVDDSSKAVLCWKCTAIMTPPPEEKKISGYPRGWKFMSEFVDKDGNVYHKGELQPELFGTLQLFPYLYFDMPCRTCRRALNIFYQKESLFHQLQISFH